MYRAALLIIIKSGSSQSFTRCMDKQTVVHWCSGLSYLVLGRNELASHEKKWMNLKLTSERSQSEKTVDYITLIMTFCER